MNRSEDDEAQVAWCQQWYIDHQKKQMNRMLHKLFFKVNMKLAWKHLIGWVKGTGMK